MIATSSLYLICVIKRQFVFINTFILDLMCKVSRLLNTKYIFDLFSMCNLIIQIAFDVRLKLFKMGINEKITLLEAQMNRQNSNIYSLILYYSKVYIMFTKRYKSMYYEILNYFIFILNQLNNHIYSRLIFIYMTNKLSLNYIRSNNQAASTKPFYFTFSNQFDERI
jgi:hypothetical protein